MSSASNGTLVHVLLGFGGWYSRCEVGRFGSFEGSDLFLGEVHVVEDYIRKDVEVTRRGLEVGRSGEWHIGE